MTSAEFRKLKKPGKPARKNKGVESALKAAIVNHLTALGYWCWVNNSGVIASEYKGRKRVIRMSPKGSPDIFVISTNGRLCGIECKAPGGKQSPSQKAWEKLAKRNGVGYCVARSVDDAISALKDWETDGPAC